MSNQIRELSVREGNDLAEKYPMARDAQCHAEARTGGRSFVCTRDAGHTGPHVAHVPGPSAVAAWTEEAQHG